MYDNTESKRSALAIPVTVLALVVGLLIAALAGAATAGRISARDKQRLDDAISLAFNGNDGYTDITADCPVKGVTAVYRVKSGTGGEDGLCVLSVSSSRGCTVKLLTAFSHDGMIASVHLLEAEGTPYNADELIEESGILAEFGGVLYNTAVVSVKGINGAEGCSTAVVRGVNSACAAVSCLLDTKESSEEVAE